MKNSKYNYSKFILQLSTIFTVVSVVFTVFIFISNTKCSFGLSHADVTPTPTESLPTPTDREKELTYYFAVKTVNDGNYKAAIPQLLNVVKIDPSQVTAYYLIGYAYRNLNKTDLAITNYETYLGRSSPKNQFRISAMIELGYLYMAKNKHPLAENIITQAENEATSSNNEKLNNVKKAINFIFNSTGYELMNLNNYPEAKWRLEKAIKASDDSYTWANVNLMRLFIRNAEDLFNLHKYPESKYQLINCKNLYQNVPAVWKKQTDYLNNRINKLERKLSYF